MKDFFKRIGRGIKKVGKKIGDFFESKVGKILGGIMLAVALPQIFSSFFSGTVTTGAGATKQATLVATKTTEKVGGEVIKKIVHEKIVGSAIPEGGLKLKGGKDIIGSKVMSITSEEAAVNLGQRFRAAAKQMGEVFTSPIDATKRTLDFMTGGRVGAQTRLSTGDVITGEFTIPQDSAFRGTSFAKPEMSANIKNFKTALNVENTSVSDALESVMTPEQFSNNNQILASNNSFRFEGPTGNWVDKATGKPLTRDQLNASTFHNTFTTRTKEQFMQNKDFREWYDKTTGLYPDSETYDPLSAKLGLRASGDYRGASEFATISDAAAGGPLAQVSHAVNKSWGELTGYTGALSETSVAKKSYGAYTTGQAMFGKQEEFRPPSYNPAAIDQVSRNLEVGSQLITSRQADNFYEPLRNATPTSASAIIKKIHQNAGMGYAYGAYAPFNNYADA